jgi:hypothetical protein
MRPIASRTKKLITAFHFQFSNQAGWECGSCRRAGLEEKRNCGWLAERPDARERVVWARKGVATKTCPKSLITAQSVTWLEEYLVRRKLGQKGIDGLDARAVEAFLILEHEVAEEVKGV